MQAAGGASAKACAAFLQQMGYREYARYLSYHFPFTHERSLLEHLRAAPWRFDQGLFKVGHSGSRASSRLIPVPGALTRSWTGGAERAVRFRSCPINVFHRLSDDNETQFYSFRVDLQCARCRRGGRGARATR